MHQHRIGQSSFCCESCCCFQVAALHARAKELLSKPGERKGRHSHGAACHDQCWWLSHGEAACDAGRCWMLEQCWLQSCQLFMKIANMVSHIVIGFRSIAKGTLTDTELRTNRIASDLGWKCLTFHGQRAKSGDWHLSVAMTLLLRPLELAAVPHAALWTFQCYYDLVRILMNIVIVLLCL